MTPRPSAAENDRDRIELAALPTLPHPEIVFFRHDSPRSRHRRIHLRDLGNLRFTFATVGTALLLRRAYGGQDGRRAYLIIRGKQPRLDAAFPV